LIHAVFPFLCRIEAVLKAIFLPQGTRKEYTKGASDK